MYDEARRLRVFVFFFLLLLLLRSVVAFFLFFVCQCLVWSVSLSRLIVCRLFVSAVVGTAARRGAVTVPVTAMVLHTF